VLLWTKMTNPLPLVALIAIWQALRCQFVRPGETYLAAKEVAIRTDAQRYVDQDNLVCSLGKGQAFDGTWAGEPLRALVVWQREPYVADLFGRALANSAYRETARYGDYVVYEPVMAS
jgi:hypothetical protein